MKARLALALLAGALSGLAASPVLAQGCIICRNTAASGGVEAGRALNLGIVVLLVPTVSIFVGIILFAFRYRR